MELIMDFNVDRFNITLKTSSNYTSQYILMLIENKSEEMLYSTMSDNLESLKNKAEEWKTIIELTQY